MPNPRISLAQQKKLYELAAVGMAKDEVAARVGVSPRTVYTYLATMAGAALPPSDAALLRVDAALGFDWRRYLGWVDNRPQLGAMLVWCYGSVLKQVAALLVCLTVLGQMRRLQVFVLAAQRALIVCGAAPAIVPALGAYPFLHIVPALDHPHLALSTVLGPAQEVARLRGAAPSIALDTIAGVVVFPSFHTVLVVLFAWAFWAVPVLRWPALALNAGMLAATPLCGGHYLADVIAGFALAVAALKGASLLAMWVSGDRRPKRIVIPPVSQPA